MRFTSEKHSSKKWEDYVELEDVHNYLDDEHPFHHLAKSRFTVLMACDSYPYERRGLLVHGKGRMAVRAFRNTAHALNDLVTDVYIYQTAFPSRWKNTLRYGVPNLKSLSLNSAAMENIFPLGMFLDGHSGKLEALEMTWGVCSEDHVHSMEKNLTGLRRLSLMFDTVRTSFAGVWKTVGNTLEELAVLEMSRIDETRTDNYEKLALKEFRSHCPNIVKLDFELPPAEVRPYLVDLFVSYGKQLQTLILIRCGLGTEDLRKICAACPSVRIDLAEYRGLNVESLIVTGKNASLVNFGCNTFDKFDTHTLRELGNVIVNLTGFCVSAYSNKVVEGINEVFRIPKPELTFARIENEKQDDNASVHDIIDDRFPALNQIEITEVRPSLEDLGKLGPKCPKVKELIFLNIHPGNEKICNCIIKGTDDNSHVPDQLKNIKAFLAAVQKFPGLDEVDYSCSNFIGGKSARVENVEQFLKLPGGRTTCLTMCGNNYS